jgi:NAD(P)-dependent dehydrogenase (short-subunit alcohol dehydrogenase family)
MSRWELAGRTVAITGAGGGLGSNLAHALRVKGCKLALLDIDTERIAPLAAELGGEPHAQVWKADVRSIESLEAAFADVAAYFGRIDVVVANAGVTVIESVAGGDPAAFERLIDINLTGVWRTYRAAIPYVSQQRGYLLGVSSMAAFIHSPLQSGYTAGKAGVWALSNSARLELRPHGVAVGTLHPTFFETPMLEQMLEAPAGEILWDGHRRAPFKTVPRDAVIAAAVKAIERRSETVTVPASNALPALAPGLFRKVIDRIGFSNSTIVEATELSDGTRSKP